MSTRVWITVKRRRRVMFIDEEIEASLARLGAACN